MAIDALDPGPNGDYPNIARNPDGTLDTRYQPIGQHWQRTPDGKVYSVDLTKTLPDGRRITDVIPAPAGGCACSVHAEG